MQSALDNGRAPSGREGTTADVVQARALAGNAAVSVAMGGGAPVPGSWPGQMLLAAQNLIGNQAVATHGGTLPATNAPAAGTPATGGQAAGIPGTGKVAPRPVVKAVPPAAAKPEQKDQGAVSAEGPDKGAAKKEAAGPRTPGSDPKFQVLRKDVRAKKRRIASSHPPPKAEAGAAQAASVPPSDDREARGKAAHAEDMDAAQPKEFNKADFVRAVEDAVAKRAPKNLDEADSFGESGKADEVKKEVQGKVGEGKEASAKEIADTTHATPAPAPDEKTVVPLAADKVPGRPGTPDPGLAAPDPLPASATDMSAGPARVDRQMADAKVTEEQLSFDNAREPGFDKAVQDKKTMEAHSETAPGQLRTGEAQEIKDVKKVAANRGAAAMTAMHGSRVTTGKNVGAGKVATKGSDEEKRIQVTAILQDVFDKTKDDVEKILKDLDKTVDDQFTRDEKRARERFTAEHERGMEEYKDRRYSGVRGKARWVKDLFADLPEEANRIYETAKAHYLTAMRQVITDIAETIERELRRAKTRIATGRKELKAAVDKLPADLKAIGRTAAADFEGKFDELRDTVDDKGTELVDTLATKYADAVKAVDDEIAAEKEKNKGLVSKAAAAIGGVIRTIKELGSLLLGVLRKAASAVSGILKDPIGFLGKLVSAVGGGLKLFAKNAGRHLEQGVLAWLLGVGGTAGLVLPPSFDILGILMIIAALLGLSWMNIRSRLVRKVPEQAVSAAETAVPLVADTKKHGVKGMWSDLKTRVGDLKKDLIKNLVGYLLPTILIAGVTWIVSLFNPASAFIRACKMIIDIIRFVVTQGRQIIEFVNAVLDAVIAIAKGGAGGVAALVENALARSIPVLIGALAAILGIGGIAGKVREAFQKLARPVNRAIDWVIDKIVGLVKKLWSKLKAAMDKRKRMPKDRDPKDRDPKTGRPSEKRAEDGAEKINWKLRTFRPKVIKKAFAMTSGETHTLSGDAGRSGLDFKLASRFAGEVRSVYANLQREVNEIANPDDKNAARTELAKLKGTLDDLEAAEKRWKREKATTLSRVKARVENRKKTKNVRKRVKTQAEADQLKEMWMAEAEHRLYRDLEETLATQIKALSRMKGLEQFFKKSGVRRIPRGFDVRERLYNYRSGWKAMSTNWRAKEKKSLVDKVRAILLKGYTPQAKKEMVPLDKARQLPESWGTEFDQGTLKVDHVAKIKHVVDHEEPLATHWLREGRGSGDDARRGHNVDISGWRLVTEKFNTSRKADGDQFSDNLELKDTFSSDIADGGIPNAKRIDGRPLLDENGKPII
ncbi:hypothetical protein SAMN05421748_105160 [Paractinoplanes atraurantiacus]|uniref:Uncharacterized protein n=1 Tax=Paractinoplanes atraurantiacus TaxID=1036182 RepID=A0A285HQF4_9ACTN|nr:hypothetical protein SAMN05421748_105160 [Actinoplanes atraurantiacus]